MEFLRLYKQNIFGIIGFFLLLILILLSFFPQIAPYDPQHMDSSKILNSPSSENFLGTDEVGRDILSLIIHGTKISLMVGFIAAGISTIIGLCVGIFSGYYDQSWGRLLVMLTDAFLAIPRLPLMLVLAAVLGANIRNVILVIGCLLWTQIARIVRAYTLSLKERPFIERCHAIGCNHSRIIWVHIFPNVLPLVFANAILLIASAIYFEVTVSFLGLGDPTHISWGMMLHYAFESAAIMEGAYWYIVPPGVAIILTVLSFTFVGRTLDEIFNPKLRQR